MTIACNILNIEYLAVKMVEYFVVL